MNTNQKEKIILEILPESSGDNPRNVCLQGCGHCPSAIKSSEEVQMAGISEAQRQVTLELDSYLNQTGQRLHALSLPAGHGQWANGEGSLQLSRMPRNINYILGKVDLAQVDIAALTEQVFTRVENLLHGVSVKPSDSSMGFCLGLTRDLDSDVFELAPLLVHFAKRLFISGVLGVKPNILDVSLDNNRVPKAKFDNLSDPVSCAIWQVENSVMIKRILGATTYCTEDTSRKVTRQRGINILRNEATVLGTSYGISISHRVMSQTKGAPGQTKVDFNSGQIIINLGPDVWLEHNSFFVNDASCRVSYDEFAEAIKSARDNEVSLAYYLKSKILDARA